MLAPINIATTDHPPSHGALSFLKLPIDINIDFTCVAVRLLGVVYLVEFTIQPHRLTAYLSIDADSVRNAICT